MLQSIKSERCKQLKRFISLLLSLLLLLLFAQHSCHHLLLFWPFIAVVQMVRGLAGHWSTIKMVSEDNNNNCNNISNIYNKDNAFTCVVFAFLAWDILILFLALISLIFLLTTILETLSCVIVMAGSILPPYAQEERNYLDTAGF